MPLKFTRDAGVSAVRVLLFGAGGVGKTTFALGAPEPVLLSGEAGAGRVPGERQTIVFGDNGERQYPESWEEVLSTLKALAVEGVPGKTLVIDGFGRIERLCANHVLATCKDDKGKPITSLSGSWGAGDKVLLAKMRESLSLIERIWSHGVNIVFVAHEKIENYKHTEGDYPRTVADLNTASQGNVLADVFNWCDFVGHVARGTTEVGARGEGPSKKPIKHLTDERTLYLDEAGTRHVKRRRGPDATMVLPAPPANAWNLFAWQVENGPKIRDEFERALATFSEERREAALEFYSKATLNEIQRALLKLGSN